MFVLGHVPAGTDAIGPPSAVIGEMKLGSPVPSPTGAGPGAAGSTVSAGHGKASQKVRRAAISAASASR